MENKMLFELDGALGRGGFLVRESILPAGKVYAPHWHDYFEWELILDGKGVHTLNSETYTLTPGCAYLLSYRDFHALRAESELRLINLRFSESALPDELAALLSPDIGQKKACFERAQTEQLYGLCMRLQTEQAANSPFGELLCRSLLTEIVVAFVRARTQDKGCVLPTLVQDAFARIHKDFRHALTLEQTAKQLCVTPNHLGVTLRRALGVSFHDYLNITRLNYACSLLAASDMPVKQVALESGYASSEYFLAVFRRRLGMTPSAYRAQNR